MGRSESPPIQKHPPSVLPGRMLDQHSRFHPACCFNHSFALRYRTAAAFRPGMVSYQVPLRGSQHPPLSVSRISDRVFPFIRKDYGEYITIFFENQPSDSSGPILSRPIIWLFIISRTSSEARMKAPATFGSKWLPLPSSMIAMAFSKGNPSL